jgi:hypothetical protein
MGVATFENLKIQIGEPRQGSQETENGIRVETSKSGIKKAKGGSDVGCLLTFPSVMHK